MNKQEISSTCFVTFVGIINLSSTRVDLQMLESKFRSFPAISLLVRTGGRVLEETKLRLTQPSLAGTGAELGNKVILSLSHFLAT